MMTRFWRLASFLLFISCSLLTASPQGHPPPLRVGIHEAFYDTVAPYLITHPHLYQLTKIRGSKLRFLIKWKKASRPFDVLIGIDPTCLDPEHINQFAPQAKTHHQRLFQDRLIPFCFSVVGFICKKPYQSSYKTLCQFMTTLPKTSLIIQHAQFSSLGKLIHEWLQPLSAPTKKILTTTKGWSGSYQLFTSGAGVCMSGYISSIQALDTQNYQVITFSESPHPVQTFYIGFLNQEVPGQTDQHKSYLIDIISSQDFQRSLEKAHVFPISSKALTATQKALLPPHLYEKER